MIERIRERYRKGELSGASAVIMLGRVKPRSFQQAVELIYEFGVVARSELPVVVFRKRRSGDKQKHVAMTNCLEFAHNWPNPSNATSEALNKFDRLSEYARSIKVYCRVRGDSDKPSGFDYLKISSVFGFDFEAMTKGEFLIDPDACCDCKKSVQNIKKLTNGIGLYPQYLSLIDLKKPTMRNSLGFLIFAVRVLDKHIESLRRMRVDALVSDTSVYEWLASFEYNGAEYALVSTSIRSLAFDVKLVGVAKSALFDHTRPICLGYVDNGSFPIKSNFTQVMTALGHKPCVSIEHFLRRAMNSESKVFKSLVSSLKTSEEQFDYIEPIFTS